MSFASPAYLIALVAVPVLVALYLRHERGASRVRDAFAPAPVRPAVTPRMPRWRRHVPAALLALALAGLVLAVARPQATVAVPVEQATVMLVSDRSGSMAATDVAPSRLIAARRAAERFLEEVPQRVRVGAIAFNHGAQVLQTPTSDHELVRSALGAITPAGSTATGDALDLALRIARVGVRSGREPPPTAIVLLSDGKSERGKSPTEVAQRAREARIPIYTVALGTPGGTIEVPARGGGTRLEPVPPDPATLREVARISGGRSYSAGDAEGLASVYERLGSQVATERKKREVTAAFAGGALLLLAGAAAASLRWFGRIL